MRKTLFAILLISLLFNSAEGQNFSVKLFVTDSNNRTDTIEFGLNDSASLEVDSSFGELNIFGQPWDSLDMRIIHRDIANYHCLMDYWSYPEAPIYYDTNMDFKLEYRDFDGYFGSKNTTFEIVIRSLNPPIIITTDFSGISGDMFEGYSMLRLLDTSCIVMETESIYFIELNDTIYTSSDTLTTLVAQFEHEVSVKELFENNIKIYPNPAQTVLNVDTDIPTIIKIFDVFGKEIKESNENTMTISGLNKGLYIIRIFEKNGNYLKTEKLIKE